MTMMISFCLILQTSNHSESLENPEFLSQPDRAYLITNTVTFHSSQKRNLEKKRLNQIKFILFQTGPPL